MLRRLALRDVVLVRELELTLQPGFTVLTGETGAGKSILVEALQLALGSRAEASLVREGAQRAEVSAEFDLPPQLLPWLEEGGFEVADDTLLLRRVVDVQGRSRAWINGSAATMAQLRELAESLVDIHGQHAWQGLTRPATVRALLDAQAGLNPSRLAARWQDWRAALAALAKARATRDTLERERERLAWQLAELDKLAPGPQEWAELEAEHRRLAHGQALLDAVRAALDAVGEGEPAADALLARALAALDAVASFDAAVQAIAEVLRSAQAQLQDAAHSLHAYLGHRDPDPARLAELDARLSAWVQLARRHRRSASELPALWADCRQELQALDAAADLDALERQAADAEADWHREARAVSAARARAAPVLASAVTQLMQTLGMAGGRFEVALLAQDEPQAFGLEAVELRVAGHAGSTPRALTKVASGGELSRLALAVAVTTSRAAAAAAATGLAARAVGAEGADAADVAHAAGRAEAAEGAAKAGAAPLATLVFDEVDSGIGGAVADSVGALMKQLGGSSQVLAVTHLAQVAACADHHLVVSKFAQDGATASAVQAVRGEARVAEIARMLGGESLSGTAHAQAMLARGERRAPEAR